MAILTVIDGVPLYSTVEEALNYANANNLVGYHTHVHNGQVGYMGGSTHGDAATSSSGFDDNTIPNDDDINVSNIPSSSSGGY
jgi:hypothetical protein|tara:strand:+ start:161 stop:409 length:249 start_codon:yes stop_codon:yes gene_type:complete